MIRHSWRRAAFALAIGQLTASCSFSDLYEPTPHVVPITTLSVLSNTASVKNTYFHDPDSEVVVCAEPFPDSAFSQSESSGFSIQFLSAGSDSGEVDDADESGELEMTGRAPHILLARELLFRSCEFARNHKLDQGAAIALYKQNLTIISQVANKVAENTSIRISHENSVNEAITVDETVQPFNRNVIGAGGIRRIAKRAAGVGDDADDDSDDDEVDDDVDDDG